MIKTAFKYTPTDKNTHKYLQLLFQSTTPPVDESTEAHAAYQQRCRRRGTTADRRINSNLNHPNNDDNDTTVITVNTVIGAAGIPADNTDTPTVGANGCLLYTSDAADE